MTGYTTHFSQVCIMSDRDGEGVALLRIPAPCHAAAASASCHGLPLLLPVHLFICLDLDCLHSRNRISCLQTAGHAALMCLRPG